MAKRKSKPPERVRCLCGTFATMYYFPSTGQWVAHACRKCQELAMEASLVPGGAILFTDHLEMEYKFIEVDEAWCEVAQYTERARRMTIDGELMLVAIFKVPMEDETFVYVGQPVPWEAVS